MLFLVDRRLRSAGAGPWTRLTLVLTVALTPWQSFAGSILHPDNFLLASLLIFVLAVRDGRVLLCALAAGAMVLAKPTGVLLLPVAWWMLGRLDTASSWRVPVARALLVVALVTFLHPMSLDMVQSMASFGRMPGSVPILTRLGAGGLALLFLGGPLLIGLAVPGIRQRLDLLHRGNPGARRREAEISLVSAAVLLGFFLAAALLRGQFKGNWILPAFVLLLPLSTVRIPRPLLVGGLVLTFVGGFAQTAVLRHPQILSQVEVLGLAVDPNDGPWAYTVHAGIRETAVSSSRTWCGHLTQYEDASYFARALRDAWREVGERSDPTWIVSDDYGLAAQLHWYLGHDDARVVIPGDGIFHRTVETLRAESDPGPLLLLPVNVPVAEFRDLVTAIAPLLDTRHPITGAALTPLMGERAQAHTPGD